MINQAANMHEGNDFGIIQVKIIEYWIILNLNFYRCDSIINYKKSDDCDNTIIIVHSKPVSTLNNVYY